jgi:uncharacterized protein
MTDAPATKPCTSLTTDDRARQLVPMAFSTLLTLLDDIATVLDDVAVMTKVAAKQTAGVVGDDLALNADQVVGVDPDREIPVVWAVAKGALLNKVILVPIALVISTFVDWLILPMLMLGGGYLAFEGFHKVWHKLAHPKEEAAEHEAHAEAVADASVDIVKHEKKKIRGAIRTDFILSAEIIVIALGTVNNEPLVTQILVLCIVAFGLTILVYGGVAGIVKIDDAGLYLTQKGGAAAKLGKAMLVGAPILMKFLSVAGTVAMFLVGGGIIAHGIHPVAEAVEYVAHLTGPADWVVQILLEGLVGIITGGIIAAVVGVVTRFIPKKETPQSAT